MVPQSATVAWLVTAGDFDHPGKFVARRMKADHAGGGYLPDPPLVADTLAELRSLMPVGLTIHEGPFVSGILEMWE